MDIVRVILYDVGCKHSVVCASESDRAPPSPTPPPPPTPSITSKEVVTGPSTLKTALRALSKHK